MNARRDAIVMALYEYEREGDEELGYAEAVTRLHVRGVANLVLALPIEQARDRVVEAARAWSAEPYAGGVPTLLAAVAELDALSTPDEVDGGQDG